MAQLLYLNSYYCPECDCAWSDEWDCGCDDECPECGCDYSPENSEWIGEGSVEQHLETLLEG